MEPFLTYRGSCIGSFHLLNAELPPNWKAPFPLHLLRLPISIIPCSSSIFKFLKLSKNYMVPADLGSFDPQDRSLMHVLVKLFNVLRCASFLCSLLPALWDQELLSLSLPQPCEVKRKKTCLHHKLIAYSEFRVEEKVEDYFPRELQKTLIGGSIF